MTCSALTRQVLSRVRLSGSAMKGTGSALVWNANKDVVSQAFELIPSLNFVIGVNSDQNILKAIESSTSSSYPTKQFLPRLLFDYKEPDERHDLVVSNFQLSTLPESVIPSTLDTLWDMTADNLVLIENSTPKSTSLLLKARTHLLETHTTCSIIAPCTHSKTCPLLKTKSPHCLFPNPEPYTPKTAKLLHVQNIHSFTYLILSRNPTPQIPQTTPQTIPGRLIKTPLKRDGHVIMDACMPSGEIERHVVAKRHGKDVYRDARKSVWGDLFDIPVSRKDEVDGVGGDEEGDGMVEMEKRRKRGDKGKDVRVEERDMSGREQQELFEEVLSGETSLEKEPSTQNTSSGRGRRNRK